MIAMGAPDHCRRQRSKDLLQKSQVFHVLMRTKGRRTSVYSSMRMQPADQISDFSSQPSSKMTSGPRYCHVLMIFSRRSCSRTVLPKSMILMPALRGRRYWGRLLFFLRSTSSSCTTQNSSLGNHSGLAGSMLVSMMFSGFKSVWVYLIFVCKKFRAYKSCFAMI